MVNLLDWLAVKPVDILLIQETKVVNEQFPALELEDKGYNLAFHGQKTYNGVCIASKFPLEDVITRLPGDESDEQARYIEAVANVRGTTLRVASAYVPNGQAVDSEKFPYKLRFLERLRAHWAGLMPLRELAVLGGDFNVAPYPDDVFNPAQLDGTVCYHPAERERMRALHHMGLYDAYRAMAPKAKQFSWWDYRAGSYERGLGLRIDHLLLSPQAMDRCEACEIDEVPRTAEKPSDHTPVIATLAV